MTRGDAVNEMGAFLPTIDLGTGRQALNIATGALNTCALLDDHSVKCWGNASSGINGQGTLWIDLGSNPNEMGDFLMPIEL